MKKADTFASFCNALALAGDEAVRALATSYNHFGQTIFASLIDDPGNVVYGTQCRRPQMALCRLWHCPRSEP
jgi:hypothetical protein